MIEAFSMATECFDYSNEFDELVRDIFALNQQDTPAAGARVTRLLQKFKANSTLLGQNLTVTSQNNYIDWSFGETGDPQLAYQKIHGEYTGLHIGYQMLPERNPEGHFLPLLSTVLNTTIHDSALDIDPRVAIITPIPGSLMSLQGRVL